MQKAFTRMKKFLQLLPLAAALTNTHPTPAAEFVIPAKNASVVAVGWE